MNAHWEHFPREADAWGERIDAARHHPAVEIKGATYTALQVAVSRARSVTAAERSNRQVWFFPDSGGCAEPAGSGMRLGFWMDFR